MEIFRNGYLFDFLRQKNRKITEEIFLKDISIDNETKKSIFENAKITPIFLDKSQITTTDPEEIMITGGRYHTFEVGSREVKGLLVVFSIPVSGNSELLGFTPSSYLLNLPQGNINQNIIQLEYKTTNTDPVKTKNRFEHDLGKLEEMIQNINNDTEKYNNSLEPFVEKEVTRRNSELEKKSKFKEGLGYPTG